MPEEVDEFGIKKKQSAVEVDEFDIPIKKKESSQQPSTSGMPAKVSPAPSVLESGTSDLETTPSVSENFESGPINYLGTPTKQPVTPAKIEPPVSITAGQTAPVGDVMSAAKTNVAAVPTAQKTTNTQDGKTEGLGTELADSFLRGSSRLGSMIAKTPAFLYDIAAYPQNKIAELTGLDMAVSSDQIVKQYGLPENEIAKYYDNAVAQSQAKLAEKYDKSITDYFAAGDYDKAFGLLANSVVESAPISVSLAMGNAAGLTTAQSILGGGAVFAADKKAELDKENPNMSEVAKMDNAMATGLFEGIFEQFGITKLGGMTKDIFLKEGVDAAKEFAEQGFKQTYAPILKKYLGTAAEESLSEAATQYAQNAVDKYSGVKPDLDLMTGVIDAGIIGLGAGTSMSALPTALEVVKTKKAVQRAGEIQEQKKALEADLVSPDVSPQNKAAISDKIKSLNEEEADLASEENKKFNELPDEKKEEVSALLAESKKIADSITDQTISEPTREIFKKDLEGIEKQIDKAYEEGQKETAEKREKETVKEPTPEEVKQAEIEDLTWQKENVGLSEEEQARFNELTGAAPAVVAEATPVVEEVAPVADVKEEVKPEINNTNENQEAENKTETEVLDTPVVETAVSTPTETVTENKTPVDTNQEVIAQDEEPAVGVTKQKPKDELLDEEDLQPERKDDEEAVTRLNTDIAAMKQYKDVDIAEKKFKAVLERAFKMREENKITKPTYTKYKKMAQQVLGGKGNVDAEEAKYKVTNLAEQVKKKLLGEGYKKVVLSTGVPVTPQQVADLIDLTAKVINKGIDAGFTVKEAVDKALIAIKTHPRYKKFVDQKSLDEEEFSKLVTTKFSPKTEEKEAVITEKSQKQQKNTPPNDKKRKTTKRIVTSEFVDPGIKEELEKEGYEYVPRGINMAQEDARKIVKHFDEGGELDTLIGTVTDNTNEMGRIERNSIAATIFEHLNKKVSREADETAKGELRKKAIKVHQFLAKNLTESAQDLRINGMLNKSIAEGDPDVAITLLKEQAQAKINADFKNKKTDKNINDAVNSINEKIIEERAEKIAEAKIQERLLKVISKETADKISSFFDNMMIKANGKFFADPTGIGGITTVLWNGSLQVIKDSLRLGIATYNGIANSSMINNAIQAGIDYIKENHSEEFNEQEYKDNVTEQITSGLKAAGIKVVEKTNRKKEIIDVVDEAVAEINGKPLQKKEKPVNAEQVKKDIDKAKKLITTSFENLKLSEFAKKKLAADVIEHLESNSGKITKSQFKDLYAEALGYDFVTPEIEAEIKANFEEIHKAEDLKDKLNSTLDEAVAKEKEYVAKNETMPAAETSEYKEKINSLRKDLLKQVLIAEKSNDTVSSHFRDEKSFYKMFASMIQGNLLTPMSQIFNISGYLFTMPIRFMTGLGGTALDYLEAGLARTKLFEKHLDKNIQTNTFTELAQGVKMGLLPGLTESVYKLKTGQLSEDFMLRDINQKFNAFEALEDFWKGKYKDKGFESKLTAFFEGHFGIPAEIMFRLLGPADITVRKSAEYGRLAEMAKAQGLEGFEFMREVLNPSEEVKEAAQKYSTKVTYQNENVVSDLLNSKKGGEFIEKMAGEKLGYHINGVLKILKTGVIPFTKTPLNIMSELIMYMMPPLSVGRALVAAKNGDRRTFNINMSRAFVGAGMSYVAYQLVANGLMTGAPDDEDTEKEKKAMYENVGYKKINWSALKRFMDGDANWSKINDGDTWLNYEKMGLPGMVMATWAGYYKDKTADEVKDRNLFSDLIGGSTAAIKASIEQSFLKGTSDALTALLNPGTKKANYFFVNYLGSIGSAIYPNTLASISKSSDPFIRDKRTDEGLGQMLINEYKTKLFMGDQLPTKITLWGEDVKGVPPGTNPYVYYLLDPIKSNDIDTQKFGYKIFDFWNSLKEADKELKNKVLPSIPKNQLEIKKQDIPLTAEEYSEFQKMVGQNRALEAQKYVLHGDFDEDKPEERVKKLQKIYANGYRTAKREFIKESKRLSGIKSKK